MVMDNEPTLATESKPSAAAPMLVMCAVCMLLGFLAGYLLRGSGSRSMQAGATVARANSPALPSEAAPTAPQAAPPEKMPSLDDMKRMADKKAEPLLAKAKSDPKNPQLENQIGLVYEKAHQFKEAAGYFEKSLQLDPKNVGVGADYASCLYYTGNVDGALAQLNQSLSYDPKHAGTLLNIGIIKWRGKNDVDGAVAAWEKLLQYHPDFPQKELLQHMIAQAQKAKSTKTVGDGQKS
jgi:cytochrome c-type biogenesis protein CcmH/NrfG